ncbi:cadherin-related family member 4-like isoform X2 [Hyperolius riggenbachi]|uniref:cadherin-related family member 4-like isoform X2 n=1 Tax=Hyperolius riggenbachi TaxID=752182 RepID=UPI0035A32DD5
MDSRSPYKVHNAATRGIYQVTSAFDLTPDSPIDIKEGKTTNKVITTASGSCNSYRLFSSVSGDLPFVIDDVTGVITATTDFDYEDRRPVSYSMRVDCVSGGLLSNRFSKALTVNIENVNEPPVCEPRFEAKIANRTIPENFPVYQSVFQVPVKDPDGDSLTYRLLSQTSRPEIGMFFDVDSRLGIVYISSPVSIDFDAGYEEFRLIIRATDPSGLSCEGGVVITIEDLNDEVPIFQKLENDTIYVPENTLPGSILHIFTATDRDADTQMTYSFPGISSMFRIHEASGALVLLQPLDYDNPDNHKAYSLVVIASDGQNRTPYPFFVYITNVDEPPECDPAISTGTGLALSVPETFPIFTTLYTVLAKDPDEGDEVKFKISQSSLDADKFFTLNEDNGIISTTDKQLDYESDPKKFAIVIKVENVKESPMFCTGLITISLQNENDEVPIFQNLPDTTIEVPENLPSGTAIMRLQATDRDIGDSVHYEFFTRYPGFFIDEDSGEIKIAYSLDYEDPDIVRNQRIIVYALDNDRVHTGVAEIIMQLTDVNDNYPQCEGFPNVIQVAETIAINTPLMQFRCSDKDIEEPNNVLTYKLSSLDYFSIDKFTLTDNILTTGPDGLDYDDDEFAGMQFTHTLHVEVSDGGKPSLTSTVTAIVRVTRVNEFNPSDPSENVFRVPENSPQDTIVGTARVTDVDWPFNNIKFSFAGGDYGNPPKFYIEPNTGIIKVCGELDYEEKSSYTVAVQAADLNNDVQPDPLKQRKTTAVVKINITNVNDEAPVCSPAYYERIIYSTRKTAILKLQCSDKDSPDEQLNYAIVSENKANRFILQRSDTGPPSIITTQNFQYNVFEGIQDPTVFQLLIEVTDELGGNRALQLSTTATVIIYVVPWTTTVPTTTQKATTAQVTTAVLVQASYFWHPDTWFTVAMTITAALFLLCLYALAWGLLKDIPKYAKFFPLCQGYKKSNPPGVTDNIPNGERKQNPVTNDKKGNENPSLLPGYPSAPAVFDGRAVDPVSGKHFLFNSYTGETKWI